MYLDAPGVLRAAARIEGDQVLSRDERVRRARHRLDRQRAPAMRRIQRVAGEYLQPLVALACPERDLAAVGAEPRPGAAGESMVETGAADGAGRPEVVLRAGDILRRGDRYAAGPGGQPPRGR